jgi:predicted RNA binding protein YcfA (HicA-like mRNA interferase family)
MGFTITAAQIMAFLRAKGFHEETGRGRHGVKMVKGGLRIPIPIHHGDMRRATAKKVLEEAGFVEDDVTRWRNGG